MEVEEGYTGLREQVYNIENETPDRFKRNPRILENQEKWANRRKATLARTPTYARDTTSSHLRGLRAKAHTKSQKPLGGRRIGAPKLQTAQRAKSKPIYEEEKMDNIFRARPLPKFKAPPQNSSRLSSASSTTQFKPFSFDSRPKKEKKIFVEEVKMDLAHEPGVIPTYRMTTRSNVSKIASTKIQPFKFDLRERAKKLEPRANVPSFCFGQAPQTSSETFMLKALDGHRLNKLPSKQATVPIEPTLHLAARGSQRKAYDEDLNKRNEEEARQKQLQDEERAALEAEELIETRKGLIHIPEPITHYKPAPERLIITPTHPVTPNAARPQVRESRRLRNRK